MTRLTLYLTRIFVFLLLVMWLVVEIARGHSTPDVLVFYRYRPDSHDSRLITVMLDIRTRLEYPTPELITLQPAASSSTSPDNRWLVFTELNYTTLNGDIFLRGEDTQVRLINHALDDHSPVWSPESSRIAFTSNRDGNYEIYIVEVTAEGKAGHLQRLTVNQGLDLNPTWWVKAP